jgi:hypothetical protein
MKTKATQATPQPNIGEQPQGQSLLESAPHEMAVQGRIMTIGTKASQDGRRSPTPDEGKITFIGPDSGQVSVTQTLQRELSPTFT